MNLNCYIIIVIKANPRSFVSLNIIILNSYQKH